MRFLNCGSQQNGNDDEDDDDDDYDNDDDESYWQSNSSDSCDSNCQNSVEHDLLLYDLLLEYFYLTLIHFLCYFMCVFKLNT